MSRSLLAERILGKLSEDELLKLAAEKLSDDEVRELLKVANIGAALGNAVAPLKDLATAGANALSHQVNPNAATHAAVNAGAAGPANPSMLGRAGEGLGHVAGMFGSGENAMPAGYQAAVALPVMYMLARKAGLIGGDEQQPKMASFFSPELNQHMDKMAQDPAVVGALAILLTNGLL